MADEHVSYEEIAAARRGSAEYREGYDEARRAFLIGQAVRERRLVVAVVCARWQVEEDFQLSKRTVGLDQGQVRTWTSWRRWSTAALTTYALLVVATLHEHATSTDDPLDLIPITCPELQHLLAATLLPPPLRDPDRIHRWSRWRRHHQAVARRCHQAWNAYADRVA
jgi:hypothetical protein